MTTARVRLPRRPDGTSTFDQPVTGRWPRRQVIWSCDSTRGPLLTRYYLLKTERFGIYVHHLQASDDSRAQHDHPWSFVTVLLSSGYYEWTPFRQMRGGYWAPRMWRPRFSILWRPAEWQHRVELVRPTWTLVFRFRRRRLWGYATRGGWVDWKTYGKEWCD